MTKQFCDRCGWCKAKKNDIITCEKCSHRTITIMDYKGENVRYVCGLYHGTNNPQFYCADGEITTHD